jgi:hypothetical protein
MSDPDNRCQKHSDRSEFLWAADSKNKKFSQNQRPSVQKLHLPSDINKIKLDASAGVGRWLDAAPDRSAQVNR